MCAREYNLFCFLLVFVTIVPWFRISTPLLFWWNFFFFFWICRKLSWWPLFFKRWVWFRSLFMLYFFVEHGLHFGGTKIQSRSSPEAIFFFTLLPLFSRISMKSCWMKAWIDGAAKNKKNVNEHSGSEQSGAGQRNGKNRRTKINFYFGGVVGFQLISCSSSNPTDDQSLTHIPPNHLD